MNFKRAIITVVLAMLAQIVPPAISVSAEETMPILWYNFENGAKDISGNGLDGTINGAVITDGMAVFDGADDYIRMPNGILKDADSATVAIYLKSEIEKQNQFTWCIGNSNETGYMFLNTYNPNSKLRAAITLTDYKAESELATNNYVSADEWTSIIAVFDGANSVMYRDGKAVATANISVKPSDLGATTANYIAKSVYNDPYFKGTVSDFRIYNRALTAEEVINLSEEQKSSYTKTAPKITSVSGDGIKSYGVEFDTVNKTVFIPVQVGTDIENLSPVFGCESDAAVTLKSGTYSDGVVTVTDAGDSSLTADWTVTAGERGNAVLDGYYADPNIAVFDGKYYIYPTTDGGTGWDAPYFKCFSSEDLVHWTDEGVILDLADVSWSNGKNGWAPTVTEKNGKYYFYYSAAPAAGGGKNLAVAVADSPVGPFVDKGVIAAGGAYSGQMIDPAVFTDDDGTSYLYWGNGSTMHAAKLTDDMLHIEGTVKDYRPGNFREGAFMIKRNGVYYLMWSADDTGSPNYHVRYGTMDSPLGTLTGNTQILHRNNANSNLIKGTGHHSVINVPGTDEWYICYHRFNTARYGNQETQSSEAGNHREVCIDKLEFDENGNIKTVTPTLEGITNPVYASRNSVYISKTEFEGRSLNWSLAATDDISDIDVYTALYDTDGAIAAVAKNQMSGEFEIDPQSEYTLKIFTWKKDTMEPVGKGYACKQIKADTSLYRHEKNGGQ
ncbi:MAG: family 43 glycosylhydrolase [Oscillospiraceae bacterium]|nr:family 43 glycosylhydrolase [Oscillospiraceae bacterium]